MGRVPDPGIALAGHPIVVRGEKYRIHERPSATLLLLGKFPAKRPTHRLRIARHGRLMWDSVAGVWRVAPSAQLFEVS